MYEVEYMDLLGRAGYIPDDVRLSSSQAPGFAFRGASQLTKDRRQRVQRMIEFELNEQREAKRRRNRRDEGG